MNERTFEVGGRRFQLNKIDAFKQFHIVRRLAPILGDLLPVAQKLSKLKDNTEAQFESLAPIMDGIAKLSDADANTVLLGLCSAVEVQQASGNWARIVVGDILAIQDLDLSTLLQIAGRALQFNLAGFFASTPQVSHGAK